MRRARQLRGALGAIIVLGVAAIAARGASGPARLGATPISTSRAAPVAAASAPSTPGAPVAVAPTAEPAPAPSRRRLVVADAGNFILYDAEPAIRADLEGAGFYPHTIGGFGLSAYPEVWHGVFGSDVPNDNPAVVVVMMGNADFDLARRDPDLYRKRLDEVVWLMTLRGAKVLWLGLPPLPPNVDDEIGRQTVNELYAELPGRYPGVVRYASTDNVLGFGGVWVRAMPDDPSRAPVRKVKPDGTPDEHVCPAGAARVARLVRDEIEAMVGGVPPEPAGWESGVWRDDLRYDSPARACRPLPTLNSALDPILG